LHTGHERGLQCSTVDIRSFLCYPQKG